ncbi:hypothetical protein [Georgenia yuyongxinii]
MYSTVAPVSSSQGATIARNESCSSPDHDPMKLTVSPLMSSGPPLVVSF